MPSENTNYIGSQTPVSVILIAYNEAKTIKNDVESFYGTIVAKLPGSELIVTEDGSTDGTSEILRDLADVLPIRLVQGKERKGYIRALFDALELSSCEWILFSDTGGKFNPQDFWKLEPYRESADLIVTVKIFRKDQLYRRLMTLVFNHIASIFFGVSVQDIDSGFRLYHRSLLEGITAEDMIFKDLINAEFSLRMLARGARLQEVPVIATARTDQSRGMPPKKIPRVIVQVLKSFPRLKKECMIIKKKSGN